RKETQAAHSVLEALDDRVSLRALTIRAEFERWSAAEATTPRLRPSARGATCLDGASRSAGERSACLASGASDRRATAAPGAVAPAIARRTRCAARSSTGIAAWLEKCVGSLRAGGLSTEAEEKASDTASPGQPPGPKL